MGNTNVKKNSVADMERGVISDSKTSDHPFFREIFYETHKNSEEKELISAYRTFNQDDFSRILKKIRTKKKDVNEENMKQLLLETLLVASLTDEIQQEIRDLLLFNDEKITKLLLDILMKLGFYSNFQRVMLLNLQMDRKMESTSRITLAEEHILDVLKVRNFENLPISRVFEISDPNVMENTLKYLLDFNKITLNNLKEFKHKMEDSGSSTFIQLLVPVMVESEKDFRPLFIKHIRRMRKEFNIEDNKMIFTADCNVLFQHAFQKKLNKVMTSIVQNHLVDVNHLVHIEKGQAKKFAFFVSEKGYSGILKQFMEREECGILLNENGRNISVFSEVVRGYCINRSSIYNPMLDKFPVDFDECVRVTLSDKRFPNALQEHSPMIDAIKYNYEYASFQLLERYGLTERIVGQATGTMLEKFLDSRVTESMDEYRVSYNFFQLTGGDQFLTVIANSDKRDLIRHPVISAYIELRSERFKILRQICLILFTTFFVIPFVCGYFLHLTDRIMALVMFGVPIFYMLAREFFQLFIYHKSQSTESVQRVDRNYCRSYLHIVNVLLVASSVATFVALILDSMIVFKIAYSMSILLMSVEFLRLLAATWTTLKVYMLMLKIIIHTYGKVFTIFLMFIFAFTFSFHVIFYNVVMSKDGVDANHSDESGDSAGHLWSSLIKTHIMLIGDYDASSGLTVWNGWWWILFALSSIIFFNFSTGLAVFDVQKFRMNADTQYLIWLLRDTEKYEILLDNFLNAESKSQIVLALRSAIMNLVTESVTVDTIISTKSDTFYELNDGDGNTLKRRWRGGRDFQSFQSIQKMKLMDDHLIRDNKFDEIARNLHEVKEMNLLLNGKIESLRVDVSNIRVSPPPPIITERPVDLDGIGSIHHELQEVKEKLNQLSNLVQHTNRRTTFYGSKTGLVPPKK